MENKEYYNILKNEIVDVNDRVQRLEDIMLKMSGKIDKVCNAMQIEPETN